MTCTNSHTNDLFLLNKQTNCYFVLIQYYNNIYSQRYFQNIKHNLDFTLLDHHLDFSIDQG